MKKIFIKNRDKKKICVVIDETKNSKGLVFIVHGLGGSKDEKHIESFAKTYKDNDFTVVRYDSTNTHGESDGKYEDATITNYYADLEDVISWSAKQKWYKEPFFLTGHSLGGICIVLYALKHPGIVKTIIPVSPVVSGKLSLKVPKNKGWKEWKKTGWNIFLSPSGHTRKLPWSHYIDRLKYDLLKDAYKINIPTLLIVGDKDTSTPANHIKKLYDKLKCEKEFHIIKNAPHVFKEEKHLSEIRNIMDKWIKKTNK